MAEQFVIKILLGLFSKPSPILEKIGGYKSIHIRTKTAVGKKTLQKLIVSYPVDKSFIVFYISLRLS